jgi:glycosyltransferase involved in cell wall biosynthesis
MKVVLIGNYESDRQNSMQRFAAIMAQGLTRAGHHVRTLRPQPFFGRLRRSGVGFGKWLGYLDKFGIFPFSLRSELKWADVVHICDHANSFYTQEMTSFPHVVTCHDLLGIRCALGEVPQNRTGWTGRHLQRLILRGLTRAQHIVCVSEATKKDLLRISGIPERRVSRVHNSINHVCSLMADNEAKSRIRKLRINPGEPFLLHVGGNQWYKNRLGVLRIFCHMRELLANKNLKLVMAGKPWPPEMRRFVTEHQLAETTLELTEIADDDLRALYSTAAMLLFPSLQEGFGWPIIEAQACGCPVVTSNRPPMDEVGGNGAIYIDPEDPRSAAAAAIDLLAKTSNLRELGLQNAARFSESAMIDSYLFLYEKVQRQLCEPSRELSTAVH